jgi:lysophospholipid acyltransferase (LPLAT)-like uncharacterized protein
MQSDYHISGNKAETESTPAERLAQVAALLAAAHPHATATPRDLGRNAFTRLIDNGVALVRRYAPPVHAAGILLTAILLFLYVRIAALTARLKSSGASIWPQLPTPCVLALWHGNAPSLIVALAKRRPASPVAIMIAGDARGDLLALLCRMLGLKVVRGSNDHAGWSAIAELAQLLTRDVCVIITADGGGPARVAKAGAVVLASVAGVPLVPIAADSHPALEETHKWDSARNPVPFCSLTIVIGQSQRFDLFGDLAALDQARSWLENTLNTLGS